MLPDYANADDFFSLMCSVGEEGLVSDTQLSFTLMNHSGKDI
jgi:hypothetical protein